MTLEEKIKQLRNTVNRLRKYTPVEGVGAEARACKRAAEGYEELADWLEELRQYKNLEEQGRLLVLPETPETEDEIDKVDWSAMQKALEEYEERVKQEEAALERRRENDGF